MFLVLRRRVVFKHRMNTESRSCVDQARIQFQRWRMNASGENSQMAMFCHVQRNILFIKSAPCVRNDACNNRRRHTHRLAYTQTDKQALRTDTCSFTYIQTDGRSQIHRSGQSDRQTGRRTKGLFIRWCVCTVYSCGGVVGRIAMLRWLSAVGWVLEGVWKGAGDDGALFK